MLSGFDGAAQLHLAEVHAAERDMMAAMETAQTERPAQQRSQQQGLTTISLEEQKILLSLDRLNHQLHCEPSARPVYTCTFCREVSIITPSTCYCL